MGITAQRVPSELERRVLYKLSEPVTTDEMPDPFTHVVVSLGSLGDTCAFPASASGAILDFFGFGFADGPNRWLTDGELDDYVEQCIQQHEKDGGAGTTDYESRSNA